MFILAFQETKFNKTQIWKGSAGAGERLFFDAMHGSTVTRASNAEPDMRMESRIAAMKTLGLATKVVSVRRKTSAPLLLSSLY